MNEAAAREAVLVRAIETTDAGRAVWSDEDRAWATRAAAEIAGSDAAPDAFIARRASLALERVQTRHPAFGRALRAVTWRSWIAPALAVAAFALGIAATRSGPRIASTYSRSRCSDCSCGTSRSMRSSRYAASGDSSRRAAERSARSRARSPVSDGRPRGNPGCRRRGGHGARSLLSPTGRARRRRSSRRASGARSTSRRSRSRSAQSPGCTSADSCSSTAPAGRARSSARKPCTRCSRSCSDPRVR